MTVQTTGKKKTGATFTPEKLADFLADKILYYYGDPTRANVLDPACGDGNLLVSFTNKVGHSSFRIIGYDTNPLYIKATKNRIDHMRFVPTNEFFTDDFLSVSPNNMDLFNEKARYEFADIVIANPPYVRTQVLGAQKAQELAMDFNLKGRIDLYYPFLMAMTNALKVGGVLGVITSNRYLSTKSGADVRKYLLANYEILEIIDLGDTKLFDAAVLPAIFIGRKKSITDKGNQAPRYSSIYECHSSNDSHIVSKKDLFQVLVQSSSGIFQVQDTCYEFRKGILKPGSDKTAIWQLTEEDTSAIYTKIESNAVFRVKDRFKVRVGIKSCADNVFISRMWDKMGIRIESQLLQPMLSQENISPWHINSSGMVEVIYPHYSIGDKKMVYDIAQFPEALRYLENFKDQLTGRKYLIKAKRHWYEYWVPQNPSLWKLPKMVFPDISDHPRFCMDRSGAIVNGNCYWICAQSEEEERLLSLLTGVCNSTLMTRYHDSKFPNKLYSGRRRYLSQYIEEYPIPDPESTASKRIIQLVDEISHTFDENRIKALALEIDSFVEEAFGLKG